MGSYIPNSKEIREQMLQEIGMKSFDDLYIDVPQKMKLGRALNIPKGKSELEAYDEVSALAQKNKQFTSIFRGAGSYNHYIPAIVKQVTAKEEFLTAYTPYQAEISQGLLQSIFEYQTMICELTGMEVSNASVYDGATAAAEAVVMCKERKKTKVCVSETVDPKVRSVIETYCFGNDTEVLYLPEKDGETDMGAWEAMDTSEVCCLLVQSPNYYGIIEECQNIAKAVHNSGAKFIMSSNPMAMGILKTPGECGADVAVGEGQPLGMPMGFGGPYIGYMACTKEMMRRMPGRIVGQTVDGEGKRGFVLTLQAREQHIRREKAGSNICSNEALCAMTVAVYLATVGAKGLEKVAKGCMANAHYLKSELEKVGFNLTYKKEFFHEFLMECPVNPEELADKLSDKGILSGLPMDGKKMLWCATEKNSKAGIDELIAAVKEVVA